MKTPKQFIQDFFRGKNATKVPSVKSRPQNRAKYKIVDGFGQT